jgi:hypothetical protein
MSEPDEIEWDVVYSYSRAQAIADGILVDVGDTAREAGISYPVAMTRAVWEKCVALPVDHAGQDEAGRLWDVCWMFRCAARQCPGDRLSFDLYVRNCERDTVDLVTLKAVCGPGDTLAPVITIMLPDED